MRKGRKEEERKKTTGRKEEERKKTTE